MKTVKVTIEMTETEWGEVHNALVSKYNAISTGFYGITGAEDKAFNKKWASDISRALAAIKHALNQSGVIV